MKPPFSSPAHGAGRGPGHASGERTVFWQKWGSPQQHREYLGPQAELGGPKSLRARGWDDAACQQSPAYSLTSSPHSSFPLLDKKDLALPTFTPHKRMCLPVLLQNGQGRQSGQKLWMGWLCWGGAAVKKPGIPPHLPLSLRQPREGGP